MESIHQRYCISPSHEAQRVRNGSVTLQQLLEGATYEQFLPVVKPCQHGRLPNIGASATANAQEIYSHCCQIREDVAGTKADATLHWNALPCVPFCHHKDMLHPTLHLTINDSLDEITKQVKRLEGQLDLIKSTDYARQEGKLISLLKSWGNYSIEVKKLSMLNKK